jgi:putative FmdB family regulatory protein
MAHFDLVCKDCNHKFVVVTKAAIGKKQKRCPECSSANVRQTLGSYFQNGPLSSPTCGAPPQRTGYG